MGNIINKILSKFLKKKKIDQTDALSQQGIKFASAKDKHLRLYYQSQFYNDLETDDMEFLPHIFEQRTYLLFGSNYSIINLINTEHFLYKIYNRIIEIEYSKIDKTNITKKYMDSHEMSKDFFNFKVITNMFKEYKICRVNYWVQKIEVPTGEVNISPKIIEMVKATDEIQLYNFLRNNTGQIFFVLNKVFEEYGEMVTKLVLYQIGMKTIDENLFTILAEYINKNRKLTSVCIYGISKSELTHLRRGDKYAKKELEDEKLEADIQNVQHLFNLYQVLINKDNLVELRLILFMNQYNFAMLALILKNNTGIRKLQIRNAIKKSMEPEIDYTFKEMNTKLDTLKDEIFCFFNYLFGLDDLEELRLTHFSFMSEINFMAVQSLKTMKSTKIFSLEKNQGLVSSDNAMVQNYNIAFLPMEYINMGYTYFHSIRRWDVLLNRQTLTEAHLGVVDYASFASLLRYSTDSVLRKINVTLNKPLSIESIPVLFDLISTHAFRAPKLQVLYVLNAFQYSVASRYEIFREHFEKLVGNMLRNKTMRRLSFSKPGGISFQLDEEIEVPTFKYIRAVDVDSCAYLIKSFQRLFHTTLSKKDLDLIIKTTIYFAFANFRKIVFDSSPGK